MLVEPAVDGSSGFFHAFDPLHACAAPALGQPALAGNALCVSHSASERGAGEVSSANYEARAFGVRAGMFIGEAKRRCPDLVVMPYEFDKYDAVSEKARSSLCVLTCSMICSREHEHRCTLMNRHLSSL